MAVAMRSSLSELSNNWRRERHELGFGVGIAYGYATLGPIGFEGRSEYSAIGTVVNLAARLCAEARDVSRSGVPDPTSGLGVTTRGIASASAAATAAATTP